MTSNDLKNTNEYKLENKKVPCRNCKVSQCSLRSLCSMRLFWCFSNIVTCVLAQIESKWNHLEKIIFMQKLKSQVALQLLLLILTCHHNSQCCVRTTKKVLIQYMMMCPKKAIITTLHSRQKSLLCNTAVCLHIQYDCQLFVYIFVLNQLFVYMFSMFVSCLFTCLYLFSCLFTFLYVCQLFVYILSTQSAVCLHISILNQLFVYIMFLSC